MGQETALQTLHDPLKFESTLELEPTRKMLSMVTVPAYETLHPRPRAEVTTVAD
jgi:hypothetical protein